MARRKVELAGGEFFHIYNRGNSKQKIFLDDHDRDRFTKLLYLCNSKRSFNFRDDIVRAGIDAWDFDRGETLVSIGAWVLMPNHFHIYMVIPSRLDHVKVKVKVNKAKNEEDMKSQISLYVEKFSKTYAQYFNIKYKRTGGLFEGKFKSVHVITNSQAKYNFSYIHLNPVKLIDSKWKENGIQDFQKVRKFLKDYKWSSYLDYQGIIRSENKILYTKAFPEYFQDIKDFNAEITEWLKFDDDE